MNAKDFDKIVASRMAWCNKTLCAKGDEYARDGDRLWNFKAAGRKRNQHPAQALAGMEVKHDVSVDDIIDGLARGIVPPKELVAEKIGDSINYLLLLEGLIEEERQRHEETPEMNAAFMMEPWSLEEMAADVVVGYSAPPLDDGDDDPAVHVVPDRTSRATAGRVARPVQDVEPGRAYRGNVLCLECGKKWPLNSEQGRTVTSTGVCADCELRRKIQENSELFDRRHDEAMRAVTIAEQSWNKPVVVSHYDE